MRFLQPCVLFAAAVIAGAVLSEAAANTGHAQPLQDLTFQGNIDVVQLPQSNFEGGGKISLTFTSDMAAIRRASVGGFTVGSPPSLVHFDRELYYDPPVPVANGTFQLGLPWTLVGMLHSALIINGQLTSDTQLTGTATIDTNGTLDSTSVPWNASGPADSLPAVGDMHSARVEGQVGTLSFWLDDNNTVTSFFLQNVSFGTCVGRPVTLRASFATPIPLEGRRMLWVSFGGTGLRFLSISGNRYADVYSGYLSLTGVYAEDCGADLKWTTAELATPTAEPTSTAAPSATATLAAKTLPATGAGARQSNRSLPVAGLAAAGAALVFVAAAFARRVR